MYQRNRLIDVREFTRGTWLQQASTNLAEYARRLRSRINSGVRDPELMEYAKALRLEGAHNVEL